MVSAQSMGTSRPKVWHSHESNAFVASKEN